MLSSSSINSSFTIRAHSFIVLIKNRISNSATNIYTLKITLHIILLLSFSIIIISKISENFKLEKDDACAPSPSNIILYLTSFHEVIIGRCSTRSSRAIRYKSTALVTPRKSKCRVFFIRETDKTGIIKASFI